MVVGTQVRSTSMILVDMFVRGVPDVLGALREALKFGWPRDGTRRFVKQTGE